MGVREQYASSFAYSPEVSWEYGTILHWVCDAATNPSRPLILDQDTKLLPLTLPGWLAYLFVVLRVAIHYLISLVYLRNYL